MILFSCKSYERLSYVYYTIIYPGNVYIGSLLNFQKCVIPYLWLVRNFGTERICKYSLTLGYLQECMYCKEDVWHSFSPFIDFFMLGFIQESWP